MRFGRSRLTRKSVVNLHRRNSQRKAAVRGVLARSTGQCKCPVVVGKISRLGHAADTVFFAPEDVNLMHYADDPIAALWGTEEERKVNAATMVLVWEALEFGLAYAKRQLADKVTCIGGTVTC